LIDEETISSVRHKLINKEFYEKTKAFVVSSLELLISFLHKGEDVPYTIVYKTKIKGNLWSLDIVDEPLYFAFVDRHRKEIESLPECAACVDVMHSDITISKHLDCLVGTKSRCSPRTAWEYLRYFLTKQLPERFDAKTFDRMYYDLEKFFYNDSVKLQVFSPIYNFSGDFDEIDFGDGLRIRRITTSELEQLSDEVRLTSQVPSTDIPSLKYVIELRCKTRKLIGETPAVKVPSPNVQARETFSKVITALRLFKQGTVGFNVIKAISMIDVPNLVGVPFTDCVYKRFRGLPYTLTEAEPVEFRSFWDTFGKIYLRKPTPLSVAIRRFNYAYERDEIEDKLVDYMIAFEAMLTNRKEKSKGRLIARRVGKLIETDASILKKIRSELWTAYQLRNDIVHEGAPNFARLKGRSFERFVEIVEEYLRRTLKEFLVKSISGVDKRAIVASLDSGQ